MKKLLISILVLLPLVGFAQNQEADEQGKILHNDKNNKNIRINEHPDAQWFPDAGLGLFIHFGISAVNGCIDISWGMMANKRWEDGELSPVEYWKLADEWNPKKFNAKAIAQAAAAAGFKYLVFTTKHHDGYTMWPSQFSDFGVKQKLNGRDFVKEVVDACHKYGLKVGLYYSPPDWKFDADYMSFGSKKRKRYNKFHELVDNVPEMPQEHQLARIERIQNQVKELLLNYGPIDLLWFDGGAGEISNEEIRKIQPGIVINKRNKEPGDYDDTEGSLPKHRFSGWFETCETCWPSRRWGYSHSDRMDTGDVVIEKLVLLRAWGGNLLANVAPAADGTIPKEALDAWKIIGKWLKHSGESVFGTKAGCYPERANQPVTIKDNVMYLHAFPDFQSKIKVNGVSKKPLKAILLRTGEEVEMAYSGGNVEVFIPGPMRSRQVDTVKLIFDSNINLTE